MSHSLHLFITSFTKPRAIHGYPFSFLKFYSLQPDGSLGTGYIENELFLVLHFAPYSVDGKVHVRDSFFAMKQLGTAQGLKMTSLRLDPYSVDEKEHMHNSFFVVKQLGSGTAQGCLKTVGDFLTGRTNLVAYANLGDCGRKVF